MNFKNSIMCLNREKLNTMNNKYIYEDHDEKLQKQFASVREHFNKIGLEMASV
jgi:hypothetical protein